MKAELQALYDAIPEMNCKGLCQQSCGPIAMSEEEDQNLIRRGVVVPRLLESVPDENYACPALENGRCSVYDERPMLCRLWGATPAMRCPFGCEPTITDAQASRLLQMSLAVGGGQSERLWE